MDLADATKSATAAILVNPLRSVLTMLGVIIGVGIIVLLIAIGEGLRVYIQTEMSAFGTNLLAVTPGKIGDAGSQGHTAGAATEDKLTYDDAEYLRRHAGPDIVAMTPVITATATLSFARRSRDTMVMGTSFDHPQALQMDVAMGRFFSQSEERGRRRVCVIGDKIREELFKGENPLGQRLRVGESKYRVTGVLAKKGLLFGFNLDDIVFIPTPTAERAFRTDELVKINIRARDGANPDHVATRVRAILMKRHDGEEDFTVTTQAAMLETVDEILGALTVVLGLLAGVSLIVGGIGIMNIMLVSVKERTREIGIRKAVGAKPFDVIFQFLVEAVLICVLGGAIGIGGTLAITAGIAHVVPGFPATPPLWAILLGAGFSTGVGAVFGVYPAIQAGRLKVVDAIRSS